MLSVEVTGSSVLWTVVESKSSPLQVKVVFLLLTHPQVPSLFLSHLDFVDIIFLACSLCVAHHPTLLIIQLVRFNLSPGFHSLAGLSLDGDFSPVSGPFVLLLRGQEQVGVVSHDVL